MYILRRFDDEKKSDKQRLNLPVIRSNLLLFLSRFFRHCLNIFMEKQHLNNQYSCFKHWLDDDFHKRCLNLV